jgi:hypothetical protein
VGADLRPDTYIWIDQECIHQDDHEDVEWHLQVMHRIYKNSKVTIVILSVAPISISIAWDLRTLLKIGDTTSLSQVYRQKYQDSDLPKWLESSVLSDAWFCRTWTFQEKLCSSSVKLLISVYPYVSSLHETTRRG